MDACYCWSRLPDDQVRTQGLYGLSWLMVYWLVNTHAKELADYQQRVAHGEASEAAWAYAFPGLPPAEMDRQLSAYSQQGEYQMFSVTISPMSFSVKLRNLTETEAHLARARIFRVAAQLATASAAKLRKRVAPGSGKAAAQQATGKRF